MYTFCAYCFLPIFFVKFMMRGLREPDYYKNIWERLGLYKVKPKKQSVFWIHAVSVGETYAIESFVQEIKDIYPDRGILITTGTPSGRQTAKQIFGETIQVVYLPLDVPMAINRFLKHFRPCVGILVETEIWPNLLKICKCKEIPIHLINARLSKKSARRYAKLYKLSHRSINHLDIIASQTRADAKRFRFFSRKPISVTGNLKFDRKIPEDQRFVGSKLREKYNKVRPIFLAASTRIGEEKIIINAVRQIRTVKNLLTVIVPRHPTRSQSIAKLLESLSIQYEIISQIDKVRKDTKILIGDELGKLFSYYYSCDIAFIGGSLLPYGGQNFLESLAIGKPTIIGPHVFNFQKLSKEAKKEGALLQVENGGQLTNAVELLLESPQLRKNLANSGIYFFNRKKGAVRKTIDLLNLDSRN